MAFIMLSMLFLLRGFLMPKPCCLAFEAFLNRFPAFFCKGKVLAAYDSTLFGSCEAFSLTRLSLSKPTQSSDQLCHRLLQEASWHAPTLSTIRGPPCSL